MDMLRFMGEFWAVLGIVCAAVIGLINLGGVLRAKFHVKHDMPKIEQMLMEEAERRGY